MIEQLSSLPLDCRFEVSIQIVLCALALELEFFGVDSFTELLDSFTELSGFIC